MDEDGKHTAAKKEDAVESNLLCRIVTKEDGTVEAFLTDGIEEENAAACMAALIAKIGTLDMDGDRFQKAMMQMAGGM